MPFTKYGVPVIAQLVGGTVECEITECQPLADGRFYLELKGLRRFKVGELTEQDGYRVAIPEVRPASLIMLVPLHLLISPSQASLPGFHCCLMRDPYRFYLFCKRPLPCHFPEHHNFKARFGNCLVQTCTAGSHKSDICAASSCS